MCVATVLSLMWSRPAISVRASPWASSASTSRSRGVSVERSPHGPRSGRSAVASGPGKDRRGSASRSTRRLRAAAPPPRRPAGAIRRDEDDRQPWPYTSRTRGRARRPPLPPSRRRARPAPVSRRRRSPAPRPRYRPRRSRNSGARKLRELSSRPVVGIGNQRKRGHPFPVAAPAHVISTSHAPGERFFYGNGRTFIGHLAEAGNRLTPTGVLGHGAARLVTTSPVSTEPRDRGGQQSARFPRPAGRPDTPARSARMRAGRNRMADLP